METTTATHEKRRALGRGLEALLPSSMPAPAGVPGAGAPISAGAGGISISAAAAPAREADSGVNDIDVGLIDRNPYQTRRSIDEQALAELAASIAANGVIQPVVVRQAGERFQLIA